MSNLNIVFKPSKQLQVLLCLAYGGAILALSMTGLFYFTKWLLMVIIFCDFIRVFRRYGLLVSARSIIGMVYASEQWFVIYRDKVLEVSVVPLFLSSQVMVLHLKPGKLYLTIFADSIDRMEYYYLLRLVQKKEEAIIL